MLKFGKKESLFYCNLCRTTLKDPVILPCGGNACKIHTEEINKVKCVFCSENHKAPQNGFPSNENLNNQIDNSRISLDFSKFNDYRTRLANLNKNLKEYEEIKNYPDNYIFEYFKELIMQVDLRRETLINDIHQYSDQLIQNIEKLKEECLAKPKITQKAEEKKDEIKSKLDHLNSTFSLLEMDEVKHEEITSWKLSAEVREFLEPALEKYKRNLQGDKYYKLTTSEIKLENIFGKLMSFDYDVERIQVNNI